MQAYTNIRNIYTTDKSLKYFLVKIETFYNDMPYRNVAKYVPISNFHFS